MALSLLRSIIMRKLIAITAQRIFTLRVFAPWALDRFPMRNDLHIARKLWHALTGSLMAVIYYVGLPKPVSIAVLGLLLATCLFMEVKRLRDPELNDSIIRFLGPFMRRSEVNAVSGVPFYLISALLAVAIFPKPIAILSILLLAWGDPIASIVGITLGHKTYRFKNGKSLAGTAAAIVACFFITYLFMAVVPGVLFHERLILATVGGIAGGTAELIPLEVDDNFAIPMISGFSLWLSFLVLGI